MIPLLGLSCSPWLSAEHEAHARRRHLVLEILALSDRTTALSCLWLARVNAIRGGTIDGSLELFRDALARGPNWKQKARR